MQDRTRPAGIQILFVMAMLALATLAMPPTAAATELQISEPKYATSPVYVNSLTEFTLSGEAEMWYRWDGYEYTQYTEPFHAEALLGGSPGGAPGIPEDLEGLQTLYYNATGETPNSIEVFVDGKSPSSEMNIIGAHLTGVLNFITRNSEIFLSSTDDGSGVKNIYYRLNDGQFTAYQNSFFITEVGDHSIQYYATDNLGNIEVTKTYDVHVDVSGPTVRISGGFPNHSIENITYVKSTTALSINAYDIAGIKNIEYRVDSGDWKEYLEPFSITNEGAHSVNARATDMLNQMSETVTVYFFVDDTPPILNIPDSENGRITLVKGNPLTINCSDSGVGECTVYYMFGNSTIPQKYTGPISLEEDGTIIYYALDALGNSVEERTLQVRVTESRPWTFYMGVALIIGAVCLLFFAFVTSGRKASEEPKAPPRKRRNKKEEVHTRPNRKKRNN